MSNYDLILSEIISKIDPLICLEAFKILSKILSNILKDPSEPKFRKINKSNAVISSKLLSCEGISKLIEEIGYTQDSSGVFTYHLPSLAPLNGALSSLQQVSESLKSRFPPEETKNLPNSDSSAAPIVPQASPHEEQTPEQLPEEDHNFKLEWSGSHYDGPISHGWFTGQGKFTFPNEVVYQGEFYKGEFHGKGTLVYPNGGKYIATWERGKMINGEYEYYDGLKYQADKWEYCKVPDRRFYTEIKEGLRPAGATLIVNDPAGPKEIPSGTYDTGEGYYEPVSKKQFTYTGASIPFPEDDDYDEITGKYRYKAKDTEDLSDDERVLS